MKRNVICHQIAELKIVICLAWHNRMVSKIVQIQDVEMWNMEYKKLDTSSHHHLSSKMIQMVLDFRW